jgi:riboflavin synthase
VKAVRRDAGGVKRPGRVGRAAKNGTRDSGVVLTIAAPFKGLKPGESIAINGACLTVETVVRAGFTVRAVSTTLERTLFGEYAPGQRVNLERAVRAADRLGGHIVQGHVDGIGVVTRAAKRGDAVVYDLKVPRAVRDVSVPLGSIAVDGVSLTVTDMPDGLVRISLVPHTLRHTNLGERRRGDRVHVEGDVLAKYIKALCRSER